MVRVLHPAFLSNASHIIDRTSPKGEPFVGKCRLCGQEGLTSSFKDVQSPCPGPQNLSSDASLLEALKEPKEGASR